jgi:hypothetical protein
MVCLTESIKKLFSYSRRFATTNGSEIQEAREVARPKENYKVKTKYQIAKT